MYGFVSYARCIADHLNILEQLLKGLAVMKELTPRQRDYIVSFGECMSTRIFAAYLNKIGVKARQVCNFLITLVKIMTEFSYSVIDVSTCHNFLSQIQYDWI